jgi:hypothetical protein
MANRGTLSLGTTTVEFSTVQLPDGLPTNAHMRISALDTFGVDGRLIVNESQQFQPFRLSATAGYGSLAAARSAASTIGSRQGYIGSLVVTAFGDSVSYPSVVVRSIVARARPSVAYGNYAVASQSAEVVLRCIIEPLEPAT